jgi:hypothetical protein
MMKHKQILKLVVYTDKDIMSENFDEQLRVIQKAMKENKFHIEMINPPKEKDE